MAGHAGVDAEEFTTLHRDQISAIQLQFGQYIKDLQQLKKPQPAAGAGVAAGGLPGANVIPVNEIPAPDKIAAHNQAPAHAFKPGAISITVTPEGFPVVPKVDFETLKKEELEDLMRNYLNKHYSTPFPSSLECQHLT